MSFRLVFGNKRLTYEYEIADSKWSFSKLLALAVIILVSIPHFEGYWMPVLWSILSDPHSHDQ